MSGAISRTTLNYMFNIIRFDTPRWQTYEHANWDKLDALLTLAFGTVPTTNAWENDVLYEIGNNAIDLVDGKIYQCLVEHTSSSTGSFAEERANNPTYWSVGAALGSLAYKNTIGTADIVDGTVTNSKLATMVANTLKGRRSTDGAVQDITFSQLKTDLDLDDVDNTADVDKPISDLTQEAIDELETRVPRRNRIINAGLAHMEQRDFEETSWTPTSGPDTWDTVVEMVSVGTKSSGGELLYKWTGSASPNGGKYAAHVQTTVTDTPTGAEFYELVIALDGGDLSDIIGRGIDDPFVFRATVRAPAGTYSVSFLNGSHDRCYVTTFTVTGGEANTHKQIEIIVPADTSGTWSSDPGDLGMTIRISLGCGSDWQTGTLNAWQAGTYRKSASQYNFMGTGSNVFELSELGLYKGSIAPPWEVPDTAATAAACRRYFQRLNLAYGSYFSDETVHQENLPVVMRDDPYVDLRETITEENAAILVDDADQYGVTWFCSIGDEGGVANVVYDLYARWF